MLRLSKLADYATAVMCQFAKTPHSLSAADVATQTQLPAPTVRKLLKQLSEAKLLNSSRGATGGYSLIQQPEKVSLLSILRAIDGPHTITDCCLPSKACQHQSLCCIKNNWQVIDTLIRQLLQMINLEQMVQGLSVNDLIEELNHVQAN